METIQVSDRTFKFYLSQEQILAEVSRVAADINRDLDGVERPLFLSVLNGSFIFASDLFRRITLPGAEITFIRMKSYSGTQSTGMVKSVTGLMESVEGRTVIIVEDIVENGYTIQRLVDQLCELGAKEVKICTLLSKPNALKVNLTLDYVAMQIPNDFIVGYGLDYNEQGRNLPDIWVVK